MSTSASTVKANNAPGSFSQPGGQSTSKTVGSQNRSSTPGARASTGKQSEMPRQPQQTIGKPTVNRSGIGALDENVLRAGFLRKVYGILTVQMVVTVAVAAMCMFTPIIRNTFLHIAEAQTSWFKWALFLPTFGSLIVLQMGAKGSYPANYIVLSIFTLSMSVQVGFVCSVFQAAGYGHLILQAFAATAIIFMGLSAYTLYSGKDFSFMGGFLAVALWGLVLTGLVGLFFPRMVNTLAYGFIGALTFSGYILYDTWRLQKQFSFDDYIGATIELYLDIVNLFLYILQILVELSKEKKKN